MPPTTSTTSRPPKKTYASYSLLPRDTLRLDLRNRTPPRPVPNGTERKEMIIWSAMQWDKLHDPGVVPDEKHNWDMSVFTALERDYMRALGKGGEGVEEWKGRWGGRKNLGNVEGCEGYEGRGKKGKEIKEEVTVDGKRKGKGELRRKNTSNNNESSRGSILASSSNKSLLPRPKSKSKSKSNTKNKRCTTQQAEDNRLIDNTSDHSEDLYDLTRSSPENENDEDDESDVEDDDDDDDNDELGLSLMSRWTENPWHLDPEDFSNIYYVAEKRYHLGDMEYED